MTLSITPTLWGCDQQHVCPLAGTKGILLHQSLIQPWRALAAAAQEAGFELAIASGFRSFERQTMIWNAKLSGERAVLDEDGHAIRLLNLSPREKIKRVMRWSSLPGASRHHWGSDVDIFDRQALAENATLQLLPTEYTGSGPFAPMIQWLKEYLGSPQAPDFFFPYLTDTGGIMPEPWHLSYRPIAQTYQQQWSLSGLRNVLDASAIAEKETVLEHLDQLYDQYIANSINPAYTV